MLIVSALQRAFIHGDSETHHKARMEKPSIPTVT